jgi:hypothetical protein
MVTALEILGLGPGASRDDINAAYKRLSLVVHPDHCNEGAGLFRLLGEARLAALDGRGLEKAGLQVSAHFVPTGPAPKPRLQWLPSSRSCWIAGVEEGVLSIFRAGDGWRWQIPGPYLGRGTYLDVELARHAAEDAYFKFFHPIEG